MHTFSDYLKKYIALIASGTAAGALVLITTLVGISPPWPQGISPLTGLVQLMVLVFVFQQLEKSAKARASKVIFKAAAIAAVSAVVYLFLFSLLRFQMTNGEYAIRGLVCTSEALLAYEAQCPFLQVPSIEEAGFDSEKLWTPAGLAVSRILLLSLWLCFFASVVTFFAAFVAFQGRRSN